MLDRVNVSFDLHSIRLCEEFVAAVEGDADSAELADLQACQRDDCRDVGDIVPVNPLSALDVGEVDLVFGHPQHHTRVYRPVKGR